MNAAGTTAVRDLTQVEAGKENVLDVIRIQEKQIDNLLGAICRLEDKLYAYTGVAPQQRNVELERQVLKQAPDQSIDKPQLSKVDARQWFDNCRDALAGQNDAILTAMRAIENLTNNFQG